MKKTTAILLIFALCFSLSACRRADEEGAADVDVADREITTPADGSEKTDTAAQPEANGAPALRDGAKTAADASPAPQNDAKTVKVSSPAPQSSDEPAENGSPATQETEETPREQAPAQPDGGEPKRKSSENAANVREVIRYYEQVKDPSSYTLGNVSAYTNYDGNVYLKYPIPDDDEITNSLRYTCCHPLSNALLNRRR